MKLAIPDPGYLHAAHVQKTMIPGAGAAVRAHALAEPDLDDHLRNIGSDSAIAQAPSHRRVETHVGPGFPDNQLTRMTP